MNDIKNLQLVPHSSWGASYSDSLAKKRSTVEAASSKASGAAKKHFSPLAGSIQIKLGAYQPIPRLIRNSNLLSLLRDLNLTISSFVFLKKRKQASITVNSGPHVHKKSREQYQILQYSAFFTIKFSSAEAKKVLDLRAKLYQRCKDFSLCTTISYLKHDTVSWPF
jgi:hypothetical protein